MSSSALLPTEAAPPHALAWTPGAVCKYSMDSAKRTRETGRANYGPWKRGKPAQTYKNCGEGREGASSSGRMGRRPWLGAPLLSSEGCEAAKPCVLLLARLPCMCVYNVKKLNNNPLCLLNAWQFERAPIYMLFFISWGLFPFPDEETGIVCNFSEGVGTPALQRGNVEERPGPTGLNTIHGYFRSPAPQPCQGLGGALGSTSFSVPIGAESPWAPFSVT